MDDELYEKLQRIDCAPERRSGGALAWTAHSAIHAIAVLAACYEQEYGWALQTEPTASSVSDIPPGTKRNRHRQESILPEARTTS